MLDINKMPGRCASEVLDLFKAGVKFDLAHDTARELFDTWIKWQGIIGYTDDIIMMLDGLRAAEVRPALAPKI